MRNVHIRQRNGAVTEVQAEPREQRSVSATGRKGFQEAGLLTLSKAPGGPSKS